MFVRVVDKITGEYAHIWIDRMLALQNVQFGAALRDSDAYPEQFPTAKLLFTMLDSSNVSSSYKISWRVAKNEDLKELLYDFVIENN